METVTQAVKMAAEYVHSCQVEDGGYFFARIPPASLRDTYFAVRTLHMFGQQPRRVDALKQFVWSSLREQPGSDAHALYLSNETLGLLGQKTDALRPLVGNLVKSPQIHQEVGALNTLYLEVVSELEQIVQLASLFVHFGLPSDRAGLADFVSSLHNADGGFGKHGVSTLATTYYATQILLMVGHTPSKRERSLAFLVSRERDVYFLEDLYYLENSRSTLGGAPANKGAVVSFVMACQRPGGGFARAKPMGIPTLEYTHYAISILKLVQPP